MLLVLFSVYPLKFLFGAWLGGGGGFSTLEDLFTVYRVYGAGLGGIWLLFTLLYWRAYRKRDELRLSPVEVILTRLDLGGTIVNVGTCALSIGLSYLPVHPYVPGAIYGTLGITMALNGTYFGRQVTKELERQRGSRDVRSPSRG